MVPRSADTLTVNSIGMDSLNGLLDDTVIGSLCSRVLTCVGPQDSFGDDTVGCL